MNKDLFVYFLAILLSAAALLFGGHRLLQTEVARGRDVGRAYLQTRAERVAADIRAKGAAPTEFPATRPAVWVSLVDEQGKLLAGHAPPMDGRCFGVAAIGASKPGTTVKVCWPGDANPGRARMRRFARAEGMLGGFFLFVFALGAVLLVRAARRARLAAARQHERVAQLSHDLRTPLTSVSICAELAADERLSTEKRQAALDEIAVGTGRLTTKLDELLSYLREPRHG